MAAALRSTIETYPFGLLAARVGEQEIDLVVRCPATDLALIADLLKQRLMPAVHKAGLQGRFWRKGFLRRALGTEGDVRRAVVQIRKEGRIHRSPVIDKVRHDENLGLRGQRPKRGQPRRQEPRNRTDEGGPAPAS